MRCSEAPPWCSPSPRQAKRAGKLPVDAGKLGIPMTGRRRSPSPDLRRPRWLAPRHRGELLIIPVFSIIFLSSSRTPAPDTCMHRRSDTPPARFRWPNQSGATTNALALIRWIFFTHAHDLIRSKSADWRIICEVLWWWRHHIDQSTFWLGPCPRGSCRGTRPTGQSLWVSLV
jgi:hypothetical protein